MKDETRLSISSIVHNVVHLVHLVHTGCPGRGAAMDVVDCVDEVDNGHGGRSEGYATARTGWQAASGTRRNSRYFRFETTASQGASSINTYTPGSGTLAGRVAPQLPRMISRSALPTEPSPLGSPERRSPGVTESPQCPRTISKSALPTRPSPSRSPSSVGPPPPTVSSRSSKNVWRNPPATAGSCSRT